VLVEETSLVSVSHNNISQVLREAAAAYKVDSDAIALNVQQKFAAKDKARTEHLLDV
jgi:ParB family chromosome partitioning protein